MPSPPVMALSFTRLCLFVVLLQLLVLPLLLPSSLSDDDVLLQSGEEDVIIAGVPVVLAIHHGLLPMAHPQAAAAPAPAAPAPRTFALLDES